VEPLKPATPRLEAAREDPEAAQRVAAIRHSASYRQADRDVDFLDRDETRGVRLQIDYLKAELLLREHDVQRTIVVFGSTRLMPPAAAQRSLDALRAEQAARPDDAPLARRVAVAERMLENSRHYDEARELGRIVSGAGAASPAERLTIITGGGPGIMEAANRGAFDAGAESVGLNITLPDAQQPNPYITPDLCLRFHYFAIRKLHFLMRARALVAFPGGYGTFDELFETLALVQTRSIAPVPVVLVGERYWRRACDFDFLVAEGMIAPEDRALFRFAESAAQAWEAITGWHAANGTPLFREP
jgi:uncharacterized protein (TIGR00730 family)